MVKQTSHENLQGQILIEYCAVAKFGEDDI